MKTPKRYLVTSALPYANGPLHIGHLAGAYLNADIYVRWLRGMQEEVLFVCGSDEHGAAITMRAMKERLTPREIVDKYHQLFEATFEGMGISFDVYDRTSSLLHHETSQDFFRSLYQQGAFTEQRSEQYFDEEAGMFLADRYIQGTCPKCNNKNAYGDQCEVCGSSLNPMELIEPRSVLTGNAPLLRETIHWYLPLDRHEAWLKEWINDGQLEGEKHHDPKAWKNHVLGQCKSWLDGGLQPRAMTRDLDWGVDVPPEVPNAAGKKLYVWLDAPIGYISATRKWASSTGGDWKIWWQDPSSALIHFIGKDNIVFHCLIFPVILKAHGGYNLPVNVPANQFMNLEGDKISTSRNWAVWVHEYLKDFPGMQDALRYNLIRNMPEQKDSEFTWRNFQETNNNELVNNLANFINRVVVLLNKFNDGVVPAIESSFRFISGDGRGELVDIREEMQYLADKTGVIDNQIRCFNFREALQTLMEISTAGNMLLQSNEPWTKVKSNPADAIQCLAVGMQYVRLLTEIMEPFLPFGAKHLREMLGLESELNKTNIVLMMNQLNEGKPIVEEGFRIGAATHLYSRIPDEVIQVQIDRLHQAQRSREMNAVVQDDSNAIAYTPEKAPIVYDQFATLDLRCGEILSAARVPKADKLLQLEVNLGYERRTVVSGIANDFSPEEVVGRKVVLVANLEPRKIRGVESRGMILMGSNPEGRLYFISPEEALLPGMTIT